MTFSWAIETSADSTEGLWYGSARDPTAWDIFGKREAKKRS